MADKKFKLSSGKDVVLLEMSVDDIDFCNDVAQIVFDNEGNQIIRNMAKARTAY